MKVTARNVADVVGVSQKTVSAVLNDKAHCYASAATKRRIQEAAARMGYVPNKIARTLRGMPSGVVGIIDALGDVDIHNALICLISDKLWEAGYSVVLGDSRGKRERGEHILKEFISWNVEGVVCYNFPETLEGSPYLKGVKHVQLGHGCIDRREGMRRLTAHLVESHGHRRLAFATVSLACNAHKHEGFLAATAGLETFLADDPDKDRMLETALRLAKESGVTAFVASNDHLAAHLMRLLPDHGLRVPGDVAVVGFDGLDYGELLRPTLTTVRQPVAALAELAVNALLRQIRGGDSSLEPTALPPLEPELVLRESCGCGGDARRKGIRRSEGDHNHKA